MKNWLCLCLKCYRHVPLSPEETKQPSAKGLAEAHLSKLCILNESEVTEEAWQNKSASPDPWIS